MRDYKKIRAWQNADDLAVMIYHITRTFPKEEIYGLTSQLRRAAYSVPANIVEGATRSSKKDYLRFLSIARASLSEVEYFLHLAGRLEYLPVENREKVLPLVKTVFALLHSLMQFIRRESQYEP